MSTFRGALTEEEFKQNLGNWRTIFSTELEDVFTQNDIFIIHSSHNLITAIGAVILYTKAGVVITVPTKPSYPGIKVAVVMQNDREYDYIIDPNIDKLMTVNLVFGAWMTAVQMPVCNLNQEILFYEGFLCHKFFQDIALVEWVRTKEYKEKHRIQVAHCIKNGNGKVNSNQAIKQCYDSVKNLEIVEKYKAVKENINKVCTIPELIKLAEQHKNIEGISDVMVLAKRIESFPTFLITDTNETEVSVYRKVKHEYNYIKDTLCALKRSSEKELYFFVDKLSGLNAKLYDFYSSYIDQPTFYDLSKFSSASNLYKVLQSFNHERNRKIKEAEEKTELYNQFQDPNRDISGWTLEKLFSIHSEFILPYKKQTTIENILKHTNYFRENHHNAPIRNTHTPSQVYTAIKSLPGPKDSDSLQKIISSVDDRFDIGSSYWTFNKEIASSINNWIDMLAILTGAKGFPHFSVKKQSEHSKADFDNFIDSLKEFKAKDTLFLLPYQVDHIYSTNDIFKTSFSKSLQKWNTRVKEYVKLSTQLTESISEYQELLEFVEWMITNNTVNLSDVYTQTMMKTSKEVWWDIINTLDSHTENELVKTLLQSFPTSDVLKRSQFENLLKKRTVSKPGFQETTFNVCTLIEEVINYIWSHGNFKALFKQYLISAINKVQKQQKTQISTATTSAQRSDPIKINFIVKNDGIPTSHSLYENDLMTFDTELYKVLSTLRLSHGTNLESAVRDFIQCLFRNANWPQLCDEDKIEFRSKDTEDYIAFVKMHICMLLDKLPFSEILKHFINNEEINVTSDDIHNIINSMSNYGVAYPTKFFSISDVKIPIQVSKKNKNRSTRLLLFDSLFKPAEGIMPTNPINNNWFEVIETLVDSIGLLLKKTPNNYSLSFELILQILDPQQWNISLSDVIEKARVTSKSHKLVFDIIELDLLHTAHPLKTDIGCDISYVYRVGDELQSFDYKNDDRDQPNSYTFHSSYYSLTPIVDSEQDASATDQGEDDQNDTSRIPPIKANDKATSSEFANCNKNEIIFLDMYEQTLCNLAKLSIANYSDEKEIKPVQRKFENDRAKRNVEQGASHSKPTSTHMHVGAYSQQTKERGTDCLEELYVMKDREESHTEEHEVSNMSQINLSGFDVEDPNDFAYDEIPIKPSVNSVKSFKVKFFVNNIFYAKELYSDMQELLNGET